MTASGGPRVSVCHIASGDRWAGAEAQVAALLRELAGDRGLALCAILLNQGRLAEEIRGAGVEVKVIPENQEGFLRMVAEAARFLKLRGVQVVHSHRYKENLLAAWAARRCGIGHVVRTQHGLPEPFAGLRNLKQSVLQAMDRLVARHATERFICVTEEMRRHLDGGIARGKLVVVHNGIDTLRVQSRLSAAEARSRLGLGAECPVMGTAGRLDPIKRLDIFLSAAKAVRNEMPTARFLIAGEGEQEARLKELAHSAGLADSVVFLGQRDDIYDVLRAMDVFVMCSDHEGLPMALLEAMYLGVPVAARGVGGIKEVIEDNVSGILVHSAAAQELAAACSRVLGDKALARRLGEGGTRRVEASFSAVRTAAKSAELYRSLVAATPFAGTD